jgi:Family of unknown function (DUF5941)
MSAATATAQSAASLRAGRAALKRYRDDGPLAEALGTLGRALPGPPAVVAAVGVAGLVALAALEGDGASDALAAAGIGWFVLLAGLTSGMAHTDRFAWAVPGLLRVGEYGGLVWIAANAGDSSHAAAFALIAALAFRHYDLVYRPRFQGVAPPTWLAIASLGWDGRLVLLWGLLAAGALPAGMFILAGGLGVTFAVECALSWTRLSVTPLSVYEDEEEEGQ